VDSTLLSISESPETSNGRGQNPLVYSPPTPPHRLSFPIDRLPEFLSLNPDVEFLYRAPPPAFLIPTSFFFPFFPAPELPHSCLFSDNTGCHTTSRELFFFSALAHPLDRPLCPPLRPTFVSVLTNFALSSFFFSILVVVRYFLPSPGPYPAFLTLSFLTALLRRADALFPFLFAWCRRPPPRISSSKGRCSDFSLFARIWWVDTASRNLLGPLSPFPVEFKPIKVTSPFGR